MSSRAYIFLALLAWLVFCAIVIFFAPARAAHGGNHRSYCGALSEIVAAITRPPWGETHRFDLLWQGAPAHIYVNEATGSWTFMVLTGPERACLIAAGRGWKQAAPAGEGGT